MSIKEIAERAVLDFEENRRPLELAAIIERAICEAAAPLVEALEIIGAMTDEEGLERFVAKTLAEWRAK